MIASVSHTYHTKYSSSQNVSLQAAQPPSPISLEPIVSSRRQGSRGLEQNGRNGFPTWKYPLVLAAKPLFNTPPCHDHRAANGVLVVSTCSVLTGATVRPATGARTRKATICGRVGSLSTAANVQCPASNGQVRQVTSEFGAIQCPSNIQQTGSGVVSGPRSRQ